MGVDAADDPGAKEIQRIYDDGVNPYSGKFYERNAQPVKTSSKG
jgi:hypothetical protein